MTTRRRWLVAYDIRDEWRLRQVHDVVRSYGFRLQYSLYVCDLTPIEKIGLLQDLRSVVNQVVDSVAFIDLGDTGPASTNRIQYMGNAAALPEDGPTVI